MASSTARELLWLIALVVSVDALFILISFLGHLSARSGTTKGIFTALWTLAVLLIVLRGLSRIRRARLGSTAQRSGGRP